MTIHSSYNEIIDNIEKRKKEIDEDIQILNEKKNKLDFIKNLYQFLDNNTDELLEFDLEPFYWMETQSDMQFIKGEKAKRVAKWNKNTPFFLPSFRKKHGEINDNKLGDMGLLIFESKKEYFSKDDLDLCSYYPKQHGLIKILKLENDLEINNEIFFDSLNTINNLGYEINNDVIAILLASNMKKDNKDKYYDYLINFYPINC